MNSDNELVVKIKRLRRKISRQKAELNRFRQAEYQRERLAEERVQMHRRTARRYRGH